MDPYYPVMAVVILISAVAFYTHVMGRGRQKSTHQARLDADLRAAQKRRK